MWNKEGVRHEEKGMRRKAVVSCLSPLASALMPLLLLGCATGNQVGFQPAGHHNRAKVAETMDIGDEAEGDLWKGNQFDMYEIELANKADEIGELEQQIATRDQEINEARQTLATHAETIQQLRQEITGRDKYNLSGGGFWIVIVAAIGFVAMLAVILALMAFVKAVTREVWRSREKGIAQRVKTETRRGVGLRHLGGILGDWIIKLTGVNARSHDGR